MITVQYSTYQFCIDLSLPIQRVRTLWPITIQNQSLSFLGVEVAVPQVSPLHQRMLPVLNFPVIQLSTEGSLTEVGQIVNILQLICCSEQVETGH